MLAVKHGGCIPSPKAPAQKDATYVCIHLSFANIPCTNNKLITLNKQKRYSISQYSQHEWMIVLMLSVSHAHNVHYSLTIHSALTIYNGKSHFLHFHPLLYQDSLQDFASLSQKNIREKNPGTLNI